MTKKQNIILCMIALFSACATAGEIRLDKVFWLLESNGYYIAAGDDWSFSANQDGVPYEIVFPASVTQQWTLAEVDDVDTNSAAFVAWRASRPDVLLAAELQQLSASLDALVFLEFGEHIDETDEQLARLSALVVSSLESNRIEYAKAETLTELQTAGAHINNLRSIISLQAKIVSLQL